MLRWFPRLQVATACFSCNPPDLHFLDPYCICMYMHYNHCHRATAHLQWNMFVLFFAQQPPQRARASSFTRFLDHTQRRITVGRTPLDEWLVRRRDIYLTTQNTTDIHAPGEIRTHNHSRRAAADLRLRPRGQWDRTALITQRIILLLHLTWFRRRLVFGTPLRVEESKSATANKTVIIMNLLVVVWSAVRSEHKTLINP